jgi:uncharacterized protein (TIGR03435 family)
MNGASRVLHAAIAIAAVGLVSTAESRAQSQPAAAPQTFDVASVKLAVPDAGRGGRGGRGGGIRTDPQMLTGRNVTLKQLIAYAYHLWNYQIAGGPNWLDSDAYEIEARTDRPFNPEQFRPMLQALLAERFKLTLHRETKQVPIYSLVVDKNGPKFHPRKGGVDASTEQRGISFDDLPSLAGILSNFCDRPVVDQTGLKGDFDLQLDTRKAMEAWEQERATQPGNDGGGPRGNAISAAAQDQFGLKLVPAKGSVELLVIDHAEKPTAN